MELIKRATINTKSTGAGNDKIIGEGVDAVVGGIDNGRALVERAEFIPPVFKTGSGKDKIEAVAEAIAMV